MIESSVTNALVRKRAELTGDIERMHERLRQMKADLEHLDATLHMLAPHIQAESIRRKAFQPPADWSRRGKMTRIVLSILRKPPNPLRHAMSPLNC
jgi:hypothetical protein